MGCFGFFLAVSGTYSCSNPGPSGSDGGTTDSGTPSGASCIKPESITSLKVEVLSYTLPKELNDDKTLVVNSLENFGTLVGGKHGLYEVNNKNLKLLGKGLVVGIIRWEEKKMFVARADKLQLWDGTLQTSGLYKQLDGSAVTTLAARTPTEMWLGTQKQVWLLADSNLSTFDQAIKGARTIRTFTDANQVVVQEQSGDFKALRKNKDGKWEERSFADEKLKFDMILPSGKDHFWGLTDGKIVQRRPKDDKAAWWSYCIEPDGSGGDKVTTKTIVQDPTNGSIWALSADAFYKITNDNKAIKLERPKSVGDILTARVTHDGALWVNDGKTLSRLGQKGGPVTYEKQIAPFLKNNCERCHATTGGTAFALDKFEHAKQYAAKIVTAIEKKSMPPDQRPLVGGNEDLFRRWIANGYKKN